MIQASMINDCKTSQLVLKNKEYAVEVLSIVLIG